MITSDICIVNGDQLPEAAPPRVDDPADRRRGGDHCNRDDDYRRDQREDERVGDPALAELSEREREPGDRTREVE
jgi:hypothetical protein